MDNSKLVNWLMESLLWSFVEQLRGTYRLAQLGLIEEEDWRNRVENEVTFYLSDPYSRAWWKNYAGPDKKNIPRNCWPSFKPPWTPTTLP